MAHKARTPPALDGGDRGNGTAGRAVSDREVTTPDLSDATEVCHGRETIGYFGQAAGHWTAWTSAGDVLGRYPSRAAARDAVSAEWGRA
jgi:hypothetical protein